MAPSLGPPSSWDTGLLYLWTQTSADSTGSPRSQAFKLRLELSHRSLGSALQQRGPLMVTTF